MFFLGVALLVYNVSYEIRSDFFHLRHLQLFGLTIIKTKLRFFKPDRIAVFSTISKKRNDWGPVSSMDTKSISKEYVIRLFDDNQYFTVFRNGSLELTAALGRELGQLLEMEIEVSE